MASSICLTSACVHAASEILYNLAPDYQDIDACTNFDQLVCSGFNDRHDIPEDRSSYSTAAQMSENGQTIIRHILEDVYPGSSQHSSFSPMNLAVMASSADEMNFNTMKTAYNACLNETAIKDVGIQPLVHLIEEVAKSFPTTKGSTTDSQALGADDLTHLSDTILLLERLGVSTFEYLGTGADDKDPVSIPSLNICDVTSFRLILFDHILII